MYVCTTRFLSCWLADLGIFSQRNLVVVNECTGFVTALNKIDTFSRVFPFFPFTEEVDLCTVIDFKLLHDMVKVTTTIWPCCDVALSSQAQTD